MHKERYRRPGSSTAAVRVRPIFDDFHRLTMDRDYEYPAHRHTNYELIVVDNGPYECRLNSAELVLVDGQVLVVQPGDEHQDHLRRGQRHFVLHFRLAVEPAAPVTLFQPTIAPVSQVCHGNHRGDIGLIREIQREAEDGAAHGGAIQDCLLEALFWRIVRDLPPAALSETIRRLPEKQRWRERISTVLERHLRGNPTVVELAGELRMSPRRLTGLCRELFGVPPARMLLQLKLRHAEARLQCGDQSVKQVSEALGFANPFHFSRVFRRHHGCPPSAA